jgi:hypothetical protein
MAVRFMGAIDHPTGEPMDEATAESPERANSLGTGIWIVLGVIISIWGAYWLWVAPLVTENRFDPLNALFSGLAFWGVIYAILLQKSELALQRRELELTRGEVRGQKEQLEAQNLTLKQQRFENTFFSLLNLFVSLIDSMEIRTVDEERTVEFKGRDCFNRLYYELQKVYRHMKHDAPSDDSKGLCVAAYDQFTRDRQVAVGHYFRTIYNIVKFVDKSHVENKQTYINILRAQLSSLELNLLFYNCISKYGSGKFMPLVEKYGLLENMDLPSLLDPKHRELFEESAYQSPS